MSDGYQIKLLRKLIREVIQKNTLSEDQRPGGGLTKFGAKYKILQSDAVADAMKALAGTSGDAEEAAKKLGISTRSMYNYIQQSKKLDSAQDRFQDEERSKEETERNLSKRSDEKDVYEDDES